MKFRKASEPTDASAAPVIEDPTPADVPVAEPPPAPAAPRSPGFFDVHDRFLETSETSAGIVRLNLRHRAIFDHEPAIFAGARVLDLGSHDGRWSFAALQAGAAHVIGLEGRPELTEAAADNLRSYGIADDRFEFRAGDAVDLLTAGGIEVDVVLNLGFLYHTLRFNELMAGTRATGAGRLVIDTLCRGDADVPTIYLAEEPVERQGNAVEDAFSLGDHVLVGRPSVAAVVLMAKAHGFDLDAMTDWKQLLDQAPGATGVGDYRQGRRITGHFHRRSA